MSTTKSFGKGRTHLGVARAQNNVDMGFQSVVRVAELPSNFNITPDVEDTDLHIGRREVAPKRAMLLVVDGRERFGQVGGKA